MTPAPAEFSFSGPHAREAVIVVLLTAIGAIVRLWGLGHLGLIHFDEGIYAIAGLWSVSPGGLSSIDPTLIPYAPPGFPVLIGMSYLFFGVSDIAAILVSIVAGTLTIPATAWLARRTFGAGAGACAAALVSFSGFHVAFSRMALTDASFLLFWVLGLIAAQQFLERPRIATAIILGLSVGLAQLFKYNGWLIGSIVILAAALSSFSDRGSRTPAKLWATWSSGLVAAIVAALVYLPWFQFVEAHGGYGKLLTHHQSYMGGVGSWLPDLRIQIEQAAGMSGGSVWEAAVYILASICLYAVCPPRSRGQRKSAVVSFVLTSAFLVVPHVYWILGAMLMLLFHRWTMRQRLLGVAWLFLSILTPFYRPYVRLWLPLQHLGWVILPGYSKANLGAKDGSPYTARLEWSRDTLAMTVIRVVVGAACFWVAYPLGLPIQLPSLFASNELPRPFAHSDSLRNAVRQALADLPAGSSGVRLLVRPPVTFYLGGRISAQAEPNLDGLLASGNPKLWAILDEAQLRQEGDLKIATEKLLRHWEIVHEYPTQLNLPTLLDIDPGAARVGRSFAVNAPLWLLRKRSGGRSR
jgi:4-amino-4-deoxy-L-arabinose transferase-like glycosyltransferase